MTFSWNDLDHLRGKDPWTLPIPPTCPRCAYILTGLPSNRCPECGTLFKWGEVQKRAGRIWSSVHRLRHANRDAKVGLIIGLASWGVLGAVHLLSMVDPGRIPLVRGPVAAALGKLVKTIVQVAPAIDFLAVLTAVVTMVLGVQAFNIRRVPLTVRPYLRDPKPDLMLGAGTTLLGLLLLAGAIILPML
jgi:hypothetical protein